MATFVNIVTAKPGSLSYLPTNFINRTNGLQLNY